MAALVGALAVAGVVVVLVAPGAVGLDQSTDAATSGRSSLVRGGIELFSARPVTGWGAGAFRTEYRQRERSSNTRATAASHTIPVTVAAEQGILGLALYVLLLISAAAVLFRGAGRSPPRMALAACFAALVLHTWTYADFLEDPFTWTLLAIGVALARKPAPAEQLRTPVAF
jgi:O-antigen ligase